MRGPLDDVIEAQQAPAELEGIAAAEEQPRSRPPGGKALLRLMQLLETAGYDETAAAAVDVAVSEDAHEEFQAHARRFTAYPDLEGATGETAFASRPRRTEGEAGEPPARGGDGTAADVAQRYIDAANNLGPPTATGPQWRSLGPWTVPNGQTYGSSRVNVSGRVSAIAVDPGNPAHVLCGAANGGIWESFDRGASWAPRTDYAATLAIGAIAFDRQNPRTVYCGTGEGNWWSYLGAGILRSTDGGTTWSTLCTDPFVGQGFYDLVVDPADSGHLLAATTGGLYVSNDSGSTWTQRQTARTWSIAIAPAEILAACGDGVVRSTDGGASWTSVTLPGAPGTWNRLAVAIAPSNPDVAYAWGSDGSAAYLSRRAGGSWAAVGAPPGVAVGQSWYDWFFAVAPDRDTQIYCGAIDVHRGDLTGATWSWINLSSKGTGSDSIHPDQHAIAFEPGRPDSIYVGNDGGLFRSDNRGINWQHRNNGLVISEFEYLAQNCGSSRWLIGGTQDNGTERWTGPSTWEHIADGDGGDCGVNRTNPTIVFHSYYGISPERSTSSGDWGTWSSIVPPVSPGEGSQFYPPFECSATNGDTIALGSTVLHVSRNNGTSWSNLALPSGALSSAMYIPDADTVFVGTTDGRIFRASWNGASWSAATALSTPRASASVSDLFVQPNNPRRMWAAYRTIGGPRVFRSDDGGSNWIDRTPGLPALPMNAVEVDNANPNRVWVAADVGVYQSLDGGATWASFSNGLPNAYIGDLLFHPHARVLRAGTRNRGAWEIPVDGWLTKPICGVQFAGSLAPNQERRWFTFNWPATWHIVWTVMPTTPCPGGPQVSWNVQVERASAEYATYWISVKNLTAQPLRFEGRYCILSRY